MQNNYVGGGGEGRKIQRRTTEYFSYGLYVTETVNMTLPQAVITDKYLQLYMEIPTLTFYEL